MKAPVYVYVTYSQVNKCIQYEAWPCKSDAWGQLHCETEIDIPEANMDDVINGKITSMRVEQQKLRADCELKVQNIEQQIGELLAIEDKRVPE